MATKHPTTTSAAAHPVMPVSAPPAPDFTEDREQCKLLNCKPAGPIGSAAGGTLKSIVHAESNALHDVTVLLNAMQSELEALDSNEDIDHLFRLAEMAKVKVAGSISAFDPHI